MDLLCDVRQLYAPADAPTRDDSKLVDAAQLNRCATKTPLDAAIMDPPGQLQQVRDTPHAPPAPAVDAEAQAQLSHNTLHAHDTQIQDTARNDKKSDLPSTLMELWIQIPHRAKMKI